MKIDFDKNISGFQDARKLKIILEHYANSTLADSHTRALVESIITELNEFIVDPEFAKFSHSNALGDIAPALQETGTPPLLKRLFSVWRLFSGPGKHELLLSRQRQELIERAERAEAMAYEALAETAEVGRQRDAALRKLKEAGIEFTPG